MFMLIRYVCRGGGELLRYQQFIVGIRPCMRNAPCVSATSGHLFQVIHHHRINVEKVLCYQHHLITGFMGQEYVLRRHVGCMARQAMQGIWM